MNTDKDENQIGSKILLQKFQEPLRFNERTKLIILIRLLSHTNNIIASKPIIIIYAYLLLL